MGGSRSLLERVSGRRNGNGQGRDEIQARIDAVTSHTPEPMQMMGQFNPGMGPNMMPGNMMGGMMGDMGQVVNPLALQEMMMNQMALMAQMANNMGMLNAQGQFPGQNGFPMNGAFPDGGMYPQQPQQSHGGNRRGGAAGRGRGRGGSSSAQWVAPHAENANVNVNNNPTAATIAAPTPQPASSSISIQPSSSSASAAGALAATVATTTTPGFTPPSRPQSPTLCKFGLKCTNAACRYSHPSPVSTPESGIVLSNDACAAGKDCADKDCIKAHVSPAAANPALAHAHGEYLDAWLAARTRTLILFCFSAPHKQPEPNVQLKGQVPCRYGAACTRVNSGCPFSHPSLSSTQNAGNNHFNQQCRFGAGCTRAACPFQHPPGRVLPSSFHRGLSASAPVVSVPTPGTGTVGANVSHNKSVVFNKPKAKDAEEGERKDNAEAAEVEASVVPKTVEAAA